MQRTQNNTKLCIFHLYVRQRLFEIKYLQSTVNLTSTLIQVQWCSLCSLWAQPPAGVSIRGWTTRKYFRVTKRKSVFHIHLLLLCLHLTPVPFITCYLKSLFLILFFHSHSFNIFLNFLLCMSFSPVISVPSVCSSLIVQCSIVVNRPPSMLLW